MDFILINYRKRIFNKIFNSIINLNIIIADEETHVYQEKENVYLWLNKVGPYHNPQETYTYFSLPFCKPTDVPADLPEAKYGGLGEVLEGHGFVQSGIAIHFGEEVSSNSLCTSTLTKEDAEHFRYAVRHHYWYQLYLDDLPVWGMVGQVQGEGSKTHANDELVSLFLQNKIGFLEITKKLIMIMNLKEFKIMKQRKPKNFDEISKLNKYVRLKTYSLCVRSNRND